MKDGGDEVSSAIIPHVHDVLDLIIDDLLAFRVQDRHGCTDRSMKQSSDFS